MKRLMVLFIASGFVVSCLTFGSTDPEATTAAEIEPYTGWTKVNDEPITGDEFGVLGRAHEGADGHREVYVNDVGEAVSAGNASLPYPEGTIIVKESYPDLDGRLSALTVMVKRDAQYDPANGNWEYLSMSPSLRIRRQGRIGLCIDCHWAAADDFVFTSKR